MSEIPEKAVEREVSTFKERKEFYVRKRDGWRVRVLDWDDGDVTWVLDPLPMVCHHVAGTCSAESFDRRFKRTPAEKETEG